MRGSSDTYKPVLDGSTFQEYRFQVSANEWAGDIALPMDLRISSWINKTVHFHDNAGTLTASPVSTGAEVLVGTLPGAEFKYIVLLQPNIACVPLELTMTA